MQEAGYQDFVFETMALLAPAKTLPERTAGLSRRRSPFCAGPRWLESWPNWGSVICAADGKGHMARVAKEVLMFRAIIAQAGIVGQAAAGGPPGASNNNSARTGNHPPVNITKIEPIAISLPMIKAVIMAGEEVRRADTSAQKERGRRRPIWCRGRLA